jgi:hypothetical protein
MISNSVGAAAKGLSRRKVLAAAAVMALAVGIMGGAGAGVRAAASDNATEHCVVQIEPLQPGQSASKVSAPVCFDTFEEALESIGAEPGDFEAR